MFFCAPQEHKINQYTAETPRPQTRDARHPGITHSLALQRSTPSTTRARPELAAAESGALQDILDATHAGA